MKTESLTEQANEIKRGGKVILIAGLPGAGKTFLAHEIAKGNPDWLIVDDIKPEQIARVKHYLASNVNIIITDPHLCCVESATVDKVVREWGATDVEWIYFENDPLACIINVERRNDGRKVENFIKMAANVYKPPVGARKVYREA